MINIGTYNGNRQSLFERNLGINIMLVNNGDVVLRYFDNENRKPVSLLCQDTDSLILNLLDVLGDRIETHKNNCSEKYKQSNLEKRNAEREEQIQNRLRNKANELSEPTS